VNAKVLGPWRPLDLLVVALPAALMAKVLDLGASVLFMLSALAVIPLAGLVGRSTEVLAETVGGSKGALLNATFGNIAELMIAALLVLNGEINILKASITGSIIGNLLLLLGVAMIVAAHNKSEVSISATSRVQATMLFLAIGILLLPTVFSFRPESSTSRLDEVSGLVALILFAIYALSMLFMLRTNQGLFGTGQSSTRSTPRGPRASKPVSMRQSRARPGRSRARWSSWAWRLLSSLSPPSSLPAACRRPGPLWGCTVASSASSSCPWSATPRSSSALSRSRPRTS